MQFETELIGKVVEARKERGISQRELAELSGVKQPAIARLESMQSTPKIDTLLFRFQRIRLEVVPSETGIHDAAVKTNHTF
ncbi:MAG: helix-turn-helix transcriptional regulator [Firmicutes bacterium]|nr:helix-turn-helix transcriptional regulator [Bacillota bacterium]